MSYYTIIGSKMFLGSALAAARTLTGISNAAPPVATSTAHGYVDNDEILIFSGFEDIDQSIFRIDQLTTDTYSLPGYDTTDTDLFPASSGGGTTQKVTTWQEITQVLNATSSGGGPRKITANPINRRNPVSKTVGREPTALQLTLAWDPALAAQISLLNTSRKLGKLPFKFTLSGGGFAYAYGTVNMSSLPTFDTGSFMSIQVDIDLEGTLTFF